MDALARLCSAGDGSRLRPVGHRIEKRGRHLGAACVVDAGEDDRVHDVDRNGGTPSFLGRRRLRPGSKERTDEWKQAELSTTQPHCAHCSLEEQLLMAVEA